jgi:hypothetical protein
MAFTPHLMYLHSIGTFIKGVSYFNSCIIFHGLDVLFNWFPAGGHLIFFLQLLPAGNMLQ